MQLPLRGITVVELSQYLAGPYAGLRLADLGARVIKVERPGTGDPCRQLTLKDILVDGDSLVFHAINRNKQSVIADLKTKDGLECVKALLREADVLTHNFRPGVMERLGLSQDAVQSLNPRLIYATITGYGDEGPWRDRPGQDLLVQALSGLTWLTGDADDPPVPFGLAVADMFCGTHLAQAVLAALFARERTGKGSLVEVSLLDSMLDVQFETLTSFFNDGYRLPERAQRNAHAYLGAPYGIYPTRDGYIAIAMGPLNHLASLLRCPALLPFADQPDQAFVERDTIGSILAAHLRDELTSFWLELLDAGDFWCADVLTYGRLLAHAGYRCLEMEQVVTRQNGTKVRTLRCPIRIDGERLYADRAAPTLGEDNSRLLEGVGREYA